MKACLVGLWGTEKPEHNGLAPGWATDPVGFLSPYAHSCAAHGITNLILHIWAGSRLKAPGERYDRYGCRTCPPRVAQAMMSGELADAMTAIDSRIILHAYFGNDGLAAMTSAQISQWFREEVAPLYGGRVRHPWIDNTTQGSLVGQAVTAAASAHHFSAPGFEPAEQVNYVDGKGTALAAAALPTLTLLSELRRSYAPGMRVPTGNQAYVVLDDPSVTPAEVTNLKGLGWKIMAHSILVDQAPELLTLI